MYSCGTKKADGTYSYEQPVTYWMPFNGGIGFHDADWRPYFGGDRYLTGEFPRLYQYAAG